MQPVHGDLGWREIRKSALTPLLCLFIGQAQSRARGQRSVDEGVYRGQILGAEQGREEWGVQEKGGEATSPVDIMQCLKASSSQLFRRGLDGSSTWGRLGLAAASLS